MITPTEIIDAGTPAGARSLRVPRPPRGMRLSEGLVVEASVLARLLGIPLLRLEAHLAIVPADFGASPDQPEPTAVPGWPGSLDDATDLLAQASRTLAQARVGG